MSSNSHVKPFDRHSARRIVPRSTLSAAIATVLGLYGLSALVPAHAQATTGTIFGSAPSSGATVQVTGGAGFNRTVPVDNTGHYSLTVPVGDYTVNLIQNGAVVQSHNNVNPVAGGASEADFVQPGGKDTSTLGTVSVTANALPAIDVTSTNQNLTITSQQLAQLPLARNAAAIALLAPGTISGASMLGGGPTGEPVVSFGGSSIVENAYYINGFNTTDPLSNTGGITLPYGSIDQQQTLTSGYGAQYGRSAGGVISQVGKSGTNDWHFGGQVLWQPTFARSSADNVYWNNPLSIQPGEEYGNLESYNQRDNSWNTVYDAYVGGPLIKDTLFMFLSAESDKTQGQTMGNVNDGNMYYYKDSNPKFYGKLDWNINSSNILSLTGIYNAAEYDPGEYYAYDNNTKTTGAFQSLGQRTKNAFKIWIGKYTSYITDNLTLNLMFGKMDGSYYTAQPAYPGYDPTAPYIGLISLENPAYTPNGPVHSQNLNTGIANPQHKSEVRNLRLDLDWKLGDHDIQFGIDNDTDIDKDDGTAMTGPGYAWFYGQTGSADAYIIGTPGGSGAYVGAGSPCTVGGKPVGCYAYKYIFTTSATVQVTQRAQYIQDNWQVTPNFLLNLGLRNDQFTNYNSVGAPYLRLTKPQWAPRIGFSWDVFGDSTMKVFGNAGRYYLAMPTSVALREASAPTYTEQYYNYSGITGSGLPINPTPIATNLPNGVSYVNGENGTPIDPRLVSAQNLKAEYQDQFVLGMQQQIDPAWVYGVTGTVNKLGRAIDDTFGSYEANIIEAAAAAQGVTIDPSDILGSILINPGAANTITIPNGSGGYSKVTLSNAALGFPKVKRNYYSLELYLEHPFDGKWFGKVDYVFSRSYGDTEGPVQSSIGQGGSSQSITEQWDFWQIMQYANGDQPNDQKHQLRLYGSYAITPEWSVGGTYRIASGTPISCLGLFGPQQSDPPAAIGSPYGSSYHWCNGMPTPPGSTGFTPWTHQLNLQVDYRPAWAQHKLDFQLQVHNVFNEQNVTQFYGQYNNGSNAGSYNPGYLLPFSLENPRYVSFGITYDW
ncbi:TonB-dependent receptor plug domain-containing protein [Rhodanobacter sp. Si-c]|uniref:TonB-dependent receptor plug domain-containing protein n=1 Tax=Rhodanobacter lycopersici TaxID=3162487 RepID=A0ABV3QIF0_9GAMM